MKHPAPATGFRIFSIYLIVLLASSVLAAAQHETVIHSFAGDGRAPEGGLIPDKSGNLYGTTVLGGFHDGGFIYELSPSSMKGDWVATTIYMFSDGSNGDAPYGELVLDTAGNLYGTASGGGNPACGVEGCGTVFELTPPIVQGGSWTETTLYSFSGGSDGMNPWAGLVSASLGNFYGTTLAGGDSLACGGEGCGTVFELSPPTAPGEPWTETVLCSFTGGVDGAFPRAPVVLDGSGRLYGTTSEGGSQDCELGCGAVFELTPSGGMWTVTVLHGFTTANGDGVGPVAGLLLDKSGALVGTTSGGGSFGFGTVFGMAPRSKQGEKWDYRVLYSFGASSTDGVVPMAGVISVDGNVLYGTTDSGGVHNRGTAFQLTRGAQGGKWKETGGCSFNGQNGSQPVAKLLLYNNALFGTTVCRLRRKSIVSRTAKVVDHGFRPRSPRG